MRFQLFIFDFDGTLADSGPWMIEALNKAAVRFGLRQLSRDQIEALRGKDNRTIMREVGVSWWRLPQIATYVRRLADDAPPPPLFDGVPAMLRTLHGAGAKLAIVSSNSEITVRRAIGPEDAALISCFGCNASMFGKASKFRQALKQTGVAPPRAITIGDETRDIEASRKAKIACGAVGWGYATPALLRTHNPDYLFDAPADIAALI
ncbi:MAG: HAD hydrolase-like protein [Hyphomonadaceae bacterium JAD_PAG50586_4]|nr:MAG: HAD hydrolase-like protein [Hyphomonadaceae bacterium JAD_PAG50586_4]